MIQNNVHGSADNDGIEERWSNLDRYLEFIIANTRYIHLLGVYADGKLARIERDRIFIFPYATINRKVVPDIDTETEVTPMFRKLRGLGGKDWHVIVTKTVKIETYLRNHKRLMITGETGSGKSTLLYFLALLYARDKAYGSEEVSEKLGVDETGFLPILLSLQKVGNFLINHYPLPEPDVRESPEILLECFIDYLQALDINLPIDFFEAYLKSGRTVVLFDGLNEIASKTLRKRVADLIENFAKAFPECRYVVTNQVADKTGVSKLGEGFVNINLYGLSQDGIDIFLSFWNYMVSVYRHGTGENAEQIAEQQTEKLLRAIRSDEQLEQNASNPMILMMMALVYHESGEIPMHKSELYRKVIDLSLSRLQKTSNEQSLSMNEMKAVLQAIALRMHNARYREISFEVLWRLLSDQLSEIFQNRSDTKKIIENFLVNVEKYTGLLIWLGEGAYAFCHVSFQEYFAAEALGNREDCLRFVVVRAGEDWWRNVILLASDYLKIENPEKSFRLIDGLAKNSEVPEPYHNLVLAAECLRITESYIETDERIQDLITVLRKELENPCVVSSHFLREAEINDWVDYRSRAVIALSNINAGFYSGDYGEPDWVEVPGGLFIMGSDHGDLDEKPVHKVHVDTFMIARVPITNTQYEIFLKETGYKPPHYWDAGRPPRGKEEHPVVGVNWYDALEYCNWLSRVTGKNVTLPSEAEWEKAARGPNDRFEYPWGEDLDLYHESNTMELKLGDTTPVGVFLEGASVFGLLDLRGNVWEWTRSLWGRELMTPDYKYPYEIEDGREDIEAPGKEYRVMRGGSFFHVRRVSRYSYRYRTYPTHGYMDLGFRTVISQAVNKYY